MISRLLCISCLFFWGAYPSVFAQESDDITAFHRDVEHGGDDLSQKQVRPAWIEASVGMRTKQPFYFGLSESYGHDTAVNNIPGLSSQFISSQAHIGLSFLGRRFTGSLSHDATLLQFPFSKVSHQQYQWTSVAFAGVASRRTSWGIGAANAYGADSASAVSTVSLSSINSGPTTQGDIYTGFVPDNTLRQYGTVVVDHQISEREALSIGGNVNFSNFFGVAPSTRQGNINVAIRHQLNERTLIGVRADGDRQEFGVGNCSTGSISGFTALEFSKSTRLDASAGPMFGPGLCTGAYQYEVLLSLKNSLGDRFYAGSSRKRGSGIISGSLWETSSFGGWQIGDTRRLLIDFNGGYTSYHGSAIAAAQNADLSGYFVAGEVRRKLARSVEFSLTARHFDRTNAVLPFSRTVFFMTYSWTWLDGGLDAGR